MNVGDIIIEEITDLGQEALDHPKKYKAMLGVSIRNHFFSKKTMRSYFKWTSKQFKETVILLMDDPDRFNFMALKGLSEEDGLKIARQMSDDTKSAYKKILRDLRIDNIRIVQFRDFINTPKYKSFYQTVTDLYKNNESFRSSIYEEMESNVSNKINHLTEDGKEVAKKTLVKYMYEETVPMLFFTTQGYNIEIDPHVEFVVKKKLYEGGFPKIYKNLNLGHRGHIFARPEFNRYGKTSQI